jgi:RNA polymerase sigma factor (sigma-70 family)
MDTPEFRNDLGQNLPIVRAFVRRICDDPQQVDDLLQDVAVAYLGRAEKPPTPDHLMAIACNLNRDRRKKAKVRRAGPLIDSLADEKQNPMLDLERNERQAGVQLAIKSLTERQKKLIHALWWEEKSYMATAEELEIELDGVKSGRSRALKKIAAHRSIRGLA